MFLVSHIAVTSRLQQIWGFHMQTRGGRECGREVTGAMWSSPWPSLLSPPVPAGHRPGPRGGGGGRLKEAAIWESTWWSETDGAQAKRPPPHTHTHTHTLPPSLTPFQDIKHAETAASLRCKNSRVSFFDSSQPRRMCVVVSQKTWPLQVLMHICHARRIGGPDGPRCNVAGASTNVCSVPRCYLYHAETHRHANICGEQRTAGVFLSGVKVISKINRWDFKTWTLKLPQFIWRTFSHSPFDCRLLSVNKALFSPSN